MVKGIMKWIMEESLFHLVLCSFFVSILYLTYPIDVNAYLEMEEESNSYNIEEQPITLGISLMEPEDKTRMSKKIEKKLLEYEKNKVNKILRVILKILTPALGEKKCKGGSDRMYYAGYYLNELMIIHKTEEYCSRRKNGYLEQLLIKAKDKYKYLKNEPKRYNYDRKMGGGRLYESELNQFVQTESKKFAVTGSVSGGIIAMIAPSVGIGGSKDMYGRRHLRLVFGMDGGWGIGFFITGQALSGKGSLAYKGGVGGVGVVAGGGKVVDTLDEKKRTGTYVEAGVGIGGMYRETGIKGTLLKMIPLGTNLKTFRKNLGIVPGSGKIPAFLQDEVNRAQSIAELKRIDYSRKRINDL